LVLKDGYACKRDKPHHLIIIIGDGCPVKLFNAFITVIVDNIEISIILKVQVPVTLLEDQCDYRTREYRKVLLVPAAWSRGA